MAANLGASYLERQDGTMLKGVRSEIMRRVGHALGGDTNPDHDARNTADLKALEAALSARVADMSADHRSQITNQAIDILRTNSAGPEAEADVRRILGI
jgi:hypothetical protein